MKLSICVITINRERQIQEALLSCLACELPCETEFVVIDNASTDSTEQAVFEVLGDCGYHYYYEKLAENLGVGGGRNYAYEKASGEFVYMLDDDAVVDVENNSKFFVQAIDFFNAYPDIVTLTTQIYDTVWKRNRIENSSIRYSDNLYKCQMFCGGSHFLRKSFYVKSPYLPNKYGYEEIPPSLRAINAGKVNAFCPDLKIIHQPQNNKWDWDDERNHALLVKGIALPYAIKKMMYPSFAVPLLWLANRRRVKLYLSNVKDAKHKVNETLKTFCKEYPIKERISLKTLFRMFKEFKLSVF